VVIWILSFIQTQLVEEAVSLQPGKTNKILSDIHTLG
jgi:hypothetical protein